MKQFVISALNQNLENPQGQKMILSQSEVSKYIDLLQSKRKETAVVKDEVGIRRKTSNIKGWIDSKDSKDF